MKRNLKNITLVTDEEFNKRFEDIGIGALDPIKDTYAYTIRILELKQAWDNKMSLENALYDMATICFDECRDEKDRPIVPKSFYEFCMEVFAAFSDTIDE